MDLVINMAEVKRRDIYVRIDLDIFLQLQKMSHSEWNDLEDWRKQILVQQHFLLNGQAFARVTGDETRRVSIILSN